MALVSISIIYVHIDRVRYSNHNDMTVCLSGIAGLKWKIYLAPIARRMIPSSGGGA